MESLITFLNIVQDDGEGEEEDEEQEEDVNERMKGDLGEMFDDDVNKLQVNKSIT